MKLAYGTHERRGKTDLFLMAVVQRLQSKGLRLADCVQSNIDRADRAKYDMDLRVLPDGPILLISEDRGGLAWGCILDTGALEQTVFEGERRLGGANLLIVNKFGKRES